MTADHSFVLKKIEKLEMLFVAFSPATRLPLLVCDEETADDQIYAFETEELLKAFAESLKEKKIPVAFVRVPGEQVKSFFLGEKKIPVAFVRVPGEQVKSFFLGLYGLAVNRVIYQDAVGTAALELTELAPRPDLEKMAAAPIPVLSPLLNLTVTYFTQKLRQPEGQKDPQIRLLEEEMVVNLMRSKFILAVEPQEAEKGENGEADPAKAKVRIPLVKTEAGDCFQPIYSDVTEFRKHAGARAASMRLVPLTYDTLLSHLAEEAKGYLLNPGSHNLVLTREYLERTAGMKA